MIPLFVICRDRLNVLVEAIRSYRLLPDVKIIIIDNGTTYEPTLRYFEQLESEGIAHIEKMKPTNSMRDISEELSLVIEEFKKEFEFDYYIVTDCDIELIQPSSNMLSIMKIMLRATDVVGTHLELADLPNDERLDFQLKTQTKQFWTQPRRISFIHNIPVIYSEAWIDTTFAMYRRDFVFKRLNRGYRLHYPFSARHLDWYMDFDDLPEDYEYYKKHCNKDIATFAKELGDYE